MTYLQWLFQQDCTFWVRQAPIFHGVVLVLILVCLAILVAIYIKARFICHIIGKCPTCHKDTLYTVQTCLVCGMTRKHANKLPGEV
jgi:hypothetical protein